MANTTLSFILGDFVLVSDKPQLLAAEMNGSHVFLSWRRPTGVRRLTNYTLIECTTETCQVG